MLVDIPAEQHNIILTIVIHPSVICLNVVMIGYHTETGFHQGANEM